MTQNNRIRKIWIYLLGIIAVPIILSIVFVILQNTIGEDIISDGLALAVINLMTYLIPFIFYIKLFGREILEDRKQAKFVSVIKYLAIFILATFVYRFVESFFQTIPVSVNQETVNEVVDFNILIGIAVTCIMGPFVEEIVYRYMIQDWLDSRIKNKLIVIFISAAIFALIHMNELDIWIFGEYFVSGLVLTILYHRKHSIYTNILVHGMFNIVQMILSLLLAAI